MPITISPRCLIVRPLTLLCAGLLLFAPVSHAIAPSGTALDPTNLTGDTAVLRATVNPNGMETTARFRWALGAGSCTGLGDVPADQSPIAAGNTDVPLTARITGLVRGSTYTFCLTASNASGSSQTLRTFVSPNAPAVTTNPPTQLSATMATLSGNADPRGTATTGWFRYSTTSPGTWCDDNFGTRAPVAGGMSLGSGTTPQIWSQPVTDLTRNTTYYVCAIAQNAAGTSFGAVYTMTTPYPALDIDQNGIIDGNTDGLLVVRYMLGLRGPALVAGAIGANAQRADAPAIEAHLQSLLK